MSQFTYQAKNGLHKSVQGIIEADTLDAAVAQVVRLGYVPVDIRPAVISKARSPHGPVGFPVRKKVSYSDTVFFIRQISDLISAGVPVLRVLTLSAQQSRNPYLKETAVKMRDYVRDGGTLSEAMGRCPDVFPKMYGNMVKAGEASGKLGEVLGRLADLAQRDLDARMQIISSLFYPGLILVIGSATIFALLTWVVPRLTTIFADLDEALPMPTIILIGLSDFLARFWIVVLIVIAAAIFYLYRLTALPQGRLWFDGFKLRLPVVGSLIHSVEIGRFARTMSTLLGNGVTIINALEVTSLVMGNEVVRREVGVMVGSVSNGSSLNAALRKSPIFPESVVTMVAVGEESGHIHQGLERMAEYFERQAQRYVKTITTLIEPLLILALGLVVGFVVLAMLMPILRMNMIIH
jgi:type II secretory pathway component PulF